MRSRGVTLSDRVYEHISLPPLIVRAVDTPYFQRLRGLKQLGVSSFLYPSAVHTRFEHSLGVAHLAQRFVDTIRRVQPELGLTESDIQLAMLAGLCHDIGHGPFSHLFEDVITRRQQQGSFSTSSSSAAPFFCHEAMGQRITEHMLRGIVGEREIDVVLALMRGFVDNKGGLPVPPYAEIISNKRSGVDVDRLDYFIRDSVCCFGKPTVDVRVSRLFSSCRLTPAAAVSPKNARLPEWEIIFEQKMALTLRELFALRAKLHKHVYQHQVTKCIGHMVGDAIAAAVPHFLVGGLTLLECCAHVDSFCKLGDWILEAIESSSDERLVASQSIIRRIRERNLYKLVMCQALRDSPSPPDGSGAQQQAANSSAPSAERIEQQISSVLARSSLVSSSTLLSPFIVDIVEISHGKGNADPLSSIRFYNPKMPWESAQQQLSSVAAGSSPLFHPMAFQERTVMVFVRDSSATAAVAAACGVWRDEAERAGWLVPALPFLNSSNASSA
jgi:HD superfamily phosphohydrolase